MKKILSTLMLIILVFSLSACSDDVVKGSVVRESADGNAILDIMPQKLLNKINIGDTVIVKIGDIEEEMPFVDELVTENGNLQLYLDRENWNITICIYNEQFLEKYNIDIGDKIKIRKK
ncbi:MAG: hypothetical protein IJW70_06825 [Clostridia bacterium]|nr:hypothetical protein [Clostridia bacterium]